MNNVIVKFTSEDDFLLELQADSEMYAIVIVDVVRLEKRVEKDSKEVYFVASYRRPDEIVKLELMMGMDGTTGIDDLMAAKMEAFIAQIEEMGFKVSAGEYDVDE